MFNIDVLTHRYGIDKRLHVYDMMLRIQHSDDASNNVGLVKDHADIS